MFFCNCHVGGGDSQTYCFSVTLGPFPYHSGQDQFLPTRFNCKTFLSDFNISWCYVWNVLLSIFRGNQKLSEQRSSFCRQSSFFCQHLKRSRCVSDSSVIVDVFHCQMTVHKLLWFLNLTSFAILFQIDEWPNLIGLVTPLLARCNNSCLVYVSKVYLVGLLVCGLVKTQSTSYCNIISIGSKCYYVKTSLPLSAIQPLPKPRWLELVETWYGFVCMC